MPSGLRLSSIHDAAFYLGSAPVNVTGALFGKHECMRLEGSSANSFGEA